MISTRQLVIGTIFGLVSLLMIVVGCTRPLSVPTSAGMVNTPTHTNTFTSVFTNTVTDTPTFTFTFTPVPTNTATPTNTGADTATETSTRTETPTLTDSPTFTDTFTSTETRTPSNTPTPTDTLTDTPTRTPTPTPTTNPRIIEDADDADNQIKLVTDANAVTRDGYWFSYDSGTNIALGYGAPGVSGGAINASGSLASNAAYAGFGFNFTDPGGTNNAGVSFYDGTVSSFTGISFWGKLGSMPASVCENADSVNANLVDNNTGTDHLKALPFTTSWQQFTVYYDEFSTLDPTQLYQLKWQPTNMLSTPMPYDILVDDIQFVTTADPNPPTPVPVGMVDDFEDGNNHMIPQAGRDGYWYTYADTTTGPGIALCPTQGAVPLNGTFQPSGNVNFTGNPSLWCLRFTGGPFTTWGAGVGINLNNGSNYDASAYTGVRFKARVTGGTATTVRFKMPDAQSDGSDNHGNTLTVTTNWVTYTLPFSGMTQEGWGTPTTFKPQQVTATQWQFTTGATFDLWVDDVVFY